MADTKRCDFCDKPTDKKELRSVKVGLGDNQSVCNLCYKKLNRYSKMLVRKPV